MNNKGWFARISLILSVCVLTATVSAGQILSTLASFGGSNGEEPLASLVQGTDGNFYGTTEIGGNISCNSPNGCGTVFRVTPGGALTTLYRFCLKSGCPDGDTVVSGLVLGIDGNFYGATNEGGAHSGGTVFKITPEGKLTTLYNFCALPGCADGEFPYATLIQASNGDFYGTTYYGGANGPYDGTIFKITSSGKFSTIYSFCSLSECADGGEPLGGLVLGIDGNLYGTAHGSGASVYGTVFKLSSTGKLSTLHSFNFTDGQDPTAALVQASNGKFYGSTFSGGIQIDDCQGGCGSLFSITPAGSFATLDTLNWSNGFEPYAAMIQATDGKLYGTTASGLGLGTIFNMTLGGALNTLYIFNGELNGFSPYGGLTQATNGIFYGTTAGDGFTSDGTVYSLDMGLGPFIAFVQPTGKAGKAAQILGQGLTGTTSVTFNGVPATSFSAVSDTYLTPVVPTGATTGPVVVTTPPGPLTSNVSFRITR